MRQRFSEFLDEPIIPVLYGTSAMRPVLSVYECDATGFTRADPSR